MAKGNLLLGTAGNSVGDVVMYRREGAQVSRVRVRKIKNPKTDAQSLQRAAFSPVAKFYSPLAVVLERSFEGLSKMKSYNKFLKTNIDLARANDWLLPKGTGFFPLPYKLSQGSLPVISGRWDVGEIAVMLDIPHVATAGATVGDFSQDMIAAGYQAGDIVTVICVAGDDAVSNFVPVNYQFALDPTSTTTLVSIQKMEIGLVYNSTAQKWVLSSANDDLGAGAVIVARYENEKWRRSTQFLVVRDGIISAIAESTWRDAAIASYGNNPGDPNPLVYLDGDTLEG